MDRTITLQEAGWPLLLIKFSWFVALLFLHNSFYWLIASVKELLAKQSNPKSVNVHGMLLSHLVMSVILISDMMHYLLFGEHWNSTTLSTAYYGIKVGSAPLGINPVQVLAFIVGFALVFYAAVFIAKFIPKPLWRLSKNRYQKLLAFFIALLVLLTITQRLMPSNWHTQQIQKLIPFFQFVKAPPSYPEIDAKFADIKNIKNKQQHALQALYQTKPTANAVTNAPDIVVVHIEALRDDLFNKAHTPKMFDWVQHSQAVSLPNHYSSSNNTVGSIFGVVSGIDGPLYQFQRENPQPLPSIKLLQSLGYTPSLYTSSSMRYQQGLDVVFQGFNNHEFVGRGNVVEDKAMLEAYIRDRKTDTTNTPRFDYVIFNSTHFPYNYPKEFTKFTPIIEKVGLSYKASDMAYMEANKRGLKNRFFNSVLYVDNLVGQLIDQLKQEQFFDNGILVVMGDHGQEFWEHNRFGHSWSLVDEQTKVLALMHAPSMENLAYQYSSHSDILPSIFYALGVDASGVTTGKVLQNHQSLDDFVNIGIGVMGNQRPSKAAVVGEGLKIQYRYTPSVEVLSIKSASDETLNVDATIRAKAINLLKRSVNRSIGFNTDNPTQLVKEQ